jgi:hypothetical protein
VGSRCKERIRGCNKTFIEDLRRLFIGLPLSFAWTWARKVRSCMEIDETERICESRSDDPYPNL